MTLRKLSPFIFLIAMVVGVAGFIPSQVFACSCVGNIPQERSFEDSAAVFTGTVTSVAVEKNPVSEILGGTPSYKRVKIDVAESWKGMSTSSRSVTVATAKHGASCGYDFKEGEKYLIYAHDGEDRYKTDLAVGLCGRTTVLSSEKAQSDLDILGTPERGGMTPQGPIDTNTGRDGFFKSIWNMIVSFFSF